MVVVGSGYDVGRRPLDSTQRCFENHLWPCLALHCLAMPCTLFSAVRDWVEYTNGNASTPMGRLRAANGHPAPYGVKYWYLGNEITLQARFPNFPNSTHRDKPPTAEEYRAMVGKVVTAMREVDASIHFLPGICIVIGR